MRARRRSTTVVALSVVVLAMLPMALTGAFAVQIQDDLGLDDTGLGLAVSLYFFAASAGSMVAGRWVDRIGWPRGVLAALSGSGVMLAGIGLIGHQPIAFMALLAGSGVVFAVAMPTSNLVLAREASGTRLGLATGLNQASMPASTLLAGLVVPVLGALAGWRVAFLGACVLVACVLVLAGRRIRRAARPDAGKVPAAPRPAVPDARQPLRMRMIGAACLVGSLLPGALTAFLVVTGVAAGMSESTAGLLLAAASFAAVAIRVAGGGLIDAFPNAGLPASAVMLGVGAVGLGLIALQTPVAIVVGALLAFGGGWGWPGLLSYTVVRAYPGSPAAATAVMVGGGSIGAALGPLCFGLLAGPAGHAVAWAVFAVLTLLSAGLMLAGAGRRLWGGHPAPFTNST